MAFQYGRLETHGANPATPMTQADYCRQCQKDRGGDRCDKCWEPPLLPENVEAVGLMVRLSTQWHMAASGHKTGLNYSAAQVLMDELDVTDRAACIDKLQLLEREMLNTWYSESP